MLKSDVNWPKSKRYKSRSHWEPVGFFSDCLCNSMTFDLMLGFFSSSAISVLSDGFASFLHNGGKMRLIINDILTEQDKKAIQAGLEPETIIPAFDIDNIELLKDTLSERGVHFFECLSWLIRNERIEIKIIAPLDGEGIAHTKCGIFSDGISQVAFEGSVNFSKTALIDNLESLTAFCSWDGHEETIEDIKQEFDITFYESNTAVRYIDVEHIKTKLLNTFEDKELVQLLEDEYEIISKSTPTEMSLTVRTALNNAKAKVSKAIEKYKADTEGDRPTPQFPYPSGPREYQKLAFENWKNNKQKGLFAMATGTGKTITSLNCLLEIYKRLGYYKAIILVPTITLVNQWEQECKKFKFSNIIKVCSKNAKWKDEVDGIKLSEQLDTTGKSYSYIIICTYASFARDKVLSDLSEFPKSQVLLIADEAHNMGAGGIFRKLDAIPYLRRIGLSATPDRQFDDAVNARLRGFFGAEEEYTYEYSMEEAIEKGVLCKYNYYPHIVRLTTNEMEEYLKISEQLVKYFNYANKDFPSTADEILKTLLLKRKRIIHKAANKIAAFKEIITDRYKTVGNLKYTLVYVPEGNAPDNYEADIFDKKDTIPDDQEAVHLIDEYTRIVRDVSNHTTVCQFTSDSSNRDQMLTDFANGDLEVLTSMKCLDEGVDVPRSELAIFCASTGNPRQFIQRRGRILRTHKDKKKAYIHDLVVVPEINSAQASFTMEKSLLENELKRVRNFALLSENVHESLDTLDDILTYYNISLF